MAVLRCRPKSGGNQHFWNRAAQDCYGLIDLLKTLDNRKYPRGERFKTLGVVTQAGFRAASKPDEVGLWLDEKTEPEPRARGKLALVLGRRFTRNGEQFCPRLVVGFDKSDHIEFRASLKRLDGRDGT